MALYRYGKQVTSIDIGLGGEWRAFGCKEVGQLLVWEWQSETYVLKQQVFRRLAPMKK